ncbi:LuxR C-terminal-related transcriptional regulator [Deinococcus aerius]|nr:LuxR C-terminal-related transcriptional regulator [Deinococcus aerius]
MSASTSPALPTPPTSLIGREREVALVEQILNWPAVSLLTLTGPGGVGKTRLALEAARVLAPRFPGGVLFVPLAPLERAEQVMPAVARALGLQPSARDVVEVVGEALAERQLLLVLDNFEHVQDAAPDLGRLLALAQGSTLLVTSRERLRLYGEHEFPVPPLGLPRPDDPVGDAVRLFLDRARAARPGLTLDEGEGQLIEDICRGLDGLPLALELAAARVRVLGLGALRDRLRDRLSLLTGGARDLPQRQQTLRAAIDWSFALLDEAERRLLARLGVFVGGFTLEAAGAVCRGEEEDVLGGLASLVDKSLVQGEARGPDTRYRLLETVREYALEQLRRGGEEEAVHAAHLKFFRERLRALRRHIEGHDQPDLLTTAGSVAELEAEWPNLLAALAHAQETRDEAALADLALHLAPLASSHLDPTAAARLRGALSAVPATSAAAGWWWYVLAFLAYRGGHLAQGQACAARCVEVFGALGDEQGLAYGLQIRAYATLPTDPAGAAADLARSLAWARPHGDSLVGAMCLSMQAMLALSGGKRDVARGLLREAIALTEEVSNHIGRGWAELILASVELTDGNSQGAQALLLNVVRVGAALHTTDLQVGGLGGVAALLVSLGRPAQALRHWAASGALAAARNYDPTLVQSLFAPWLAPLLSRGHEPELARALQEGQAADPEALMATLLAAGLPEERPAPTPGRDPAAFTLTPREREVLSLLSQGLSNKQIAARLGTGVYTVTDQVKAVLGKLGVNNRAAATRYALEHGLS